MAVYEGVRRTWYDIYLLPELIYEELYDSVTEISSNDIFPEIVIGESRRDTLIRSNCRFVTIPRHICKIREYEFDHDVRRRIGITSYVLHWVSNRCISSMRYNEMLSSAFGSSRASISLDDGALPLTTVFTHYDGSSMATYNANRLLEQFHITKPEYIRGSHDRWLVDNTFDRLYEICDWTLQLEVEHMKCVDELYRELVMTIELPDFGAPLDPYLRYGYSNLGHDGKYIIRVEPEEASDWVTDVDLEENIIEDHDCKPISERPTNVSK